MDSFLLNYVTSLGPLAFAVVFFGIVLEGEMTLFTAAFLTQQGYFQPAEMAVLALAASHLGDWGWYVAGRGFCHPGTAIDRWVCRLCGPLDRLLAANPVRTVFVNKFVYGLSHLTLLRAGATKVAAKNIARADLPAATAWFLVIGSLGYFFSASAALVKDYIRYSEIALLAGLLLLLGLRRGWRRLRKC